MGKILSNVLGLGRHADCKTCDVKIAEEGGNRTNRWRGVSNPVESNQRNDRDGSRNIDGTACNDSRTGKHQPKPGSIW